MTYRLAEAGYYVLPVDVAGETFKQNGLTNAADIHGVDAKKLNEIFGADAGLYVTISKYGTTYAVIDSVTVGSVDAKLVDLKTGALLWQGAASASSNEGNNSGGGGGQADHQHQHRCQPPYRRHGECALAVGRRAERLAVRPPFGTLPGAVIA